MFQLQGLPFINGLCLFLPAAPKITTLACKWCPRVTSQDAFCTSVPTSFQAASQSEGKVRSLLRVASQAVVCTLGRVDRHRQLLGWPPQAAVCTCESRHAFSRLPRKVHRLCHSAIVGGAKSPHTRSAIGPRREHDRD